VREDGHRFGLGAVIRRRQRPPEGHFYSERREIVVCHRLEEGHLGHRLVPHARRVADLGGPDGLERVGRLGVVEVVEVGDVQVWAGVLAREDAHQSARIDSREGLVEAVDVRHHRQAGGETERENRDGQSALSRLASQVPKGPAQVIDHARFLTGGSECGGGVQIEQSASRSASSRVMLFLWLSKA